MLKSTGMVRRVDDLGRIVIPKELRKTQGIDINDPIEIYTDDGRIILKKYEPGCMFCGDADDVVDYKGKYLCRKCLNELVKHN